MKTVFLWLNMISAGVIFVHCVCRLSVRRWNWRQPELWAHAVLCGGSVGVIGHGLAQGGVAHPAEIIINCGTAAYFLSQTWRLMLLMRFK
ncbi:hypothetical protein [Neisseria musculi]|uniref:Membrane protein n=1 Tax=Neisseria musculi TaxID=1815583 RepID=A0A7H1MCK3_9NEIS|nr:hypothetical protein [Neisseria musculi]QNT59368.1 putative membrane protein [Neisseria musculi]